MVLAALLSSDMRVNLIGGGLVVLGLVLLFVTLVFWRAAVEDPEVLAPLEVMADRRFAKADEHDRVAMLDEHRPQGASRVEHAVPAAVLRREPASEPRRPHRDRFDHSDDAVEVIEASQVIDPLLQSHREEK